MNPHKKNLSKPRKFIVGVTLPLLFIAATSCKETAKQAANPEATVQATQQGTGAGNGDLNPRTTEAPPNTTATPIPDENGKPLPGKVINSVFVPGEDIDGVFKPGRKINGVFTEGQYQNGTFVQGKTIDGVFQAATGSNSYTPGPNNYQTDYSQGNNVQNTSAQDTWGTSLNNSSNSTYTSTNSTFTNSNDNTPLYGQWFGLCAYNQGNGSCNVSADFVSTSKACPNGFTFAEFTTRYNKADQNGLSEVSAGTCIYTGALSQNQRNNPQAYAHAGAFYGLCVYSANSSSCDKSSIPPMNKQKACPNGFRFVHVSARAQGTDNVWTATCMLDDQNMGQRQPPPYSGALAGICAYEYNNQSSGCNKGSSGLGNSMSRMSCPNGFKALPLTARVNGLNETWASTCIKQ